MVDSSIYIHREKLFLIVLIVNSALVWYPDSFRSPLACLKLAGAKSNDVSWNACVIFMDFQPFSMHPFSFGQIFHLTQALEAFYLQILDVFAKQQM